MSCKSVYADKSSVSNCPLVRCICVNGAVGAKDTDNRLLFHGAHREVNCVAFDKSIDERFCHAIYTLVRFGLFEKSIDVTRGLLYSARFSCSSNGFPLRSIADIPL